MCEVQLSISLNKKCDLQFFLAVFRRRAYHEILFEPIYFENFIEFKSKLRSLM